MHVGFLPSTYINKKIQFARRANKQSMASQESEILSIFGDNLRRIRQEKGYSQRELSSRCNVDNADISRMEKGDINVTLRTAAQLADALDTRVIDLLIKRLV
nr:helix-turn-helix transcriptional regulator [Chitinophaga barathri]